jgi:6,7-dimethyl-8-ribityllumazine synthase
MTDGEQRYGTYDPFEDTGDWPFRDAPPRPEDEAVDEPFFSSVPSEDTPGPSLVAEEETPAVVPDEAPEPEPEATPEEQPVPAEQIGGADAAPLAAEAATPVEAGVLVDEDSAVDSVQAEVEEAEPEEPEFEEAEDEEELELEEDAEPVDLLAEHAPGQLVVPSGVDVLTGGPHGFRRSVAVVVGRFNGDVTTQLLEHALEALRECHVSDDAITVVPVPGAFELPLAALALAKTRRYACVVALGCVIRGETPHFDVVAGEAASGLQLAAIETGIPVSFGVLTCDTKEQAEARVGRGADAVYAALEMADLFAHVRTRAAQQ